jgi:ATP-dependent DNA ligase
MASSPPTLPSPPKWVEPYIPTLISKPPKGPNWRHEIKWDGYRISITVNDRKTKVRTRNGLDWTEKFWTIADEAAKLKCRNAIIDGAAVVLDDTVGTGWSEAEGLALKKRLDALTIREAALEGVMARGALWINPSLGAKIEYRGLTSGGELRQASFKGLRER